MISHHTGAACATPPTLLILGEYEKHQNLRITDSSSTLFVSSSGLEAAKGLIASYKQNHIPAMTPELWSAKKVVDATLHPGMCRLHVFTSHQLTQQTPVNPFSCLSACQLM
jgi:hypothetical protein